MALYFWGPLVRATKCDLSLKWYSNIKYAELVQVCSIIDL